MDFTVKTSSKKHAPMEAGVYPARIVQLVDLGVQETEWQGEIKKQPKVQITFEFPTETIEVEGEQKPRWLGKEYTASLHEKGALFALLNAVDPGLKLTAGGRNPKGMLGLAASVTVGHTASGNAKVANVAGIMKGMKVDELVNPVVFFDLKDKTTWDSFEKLPPWLQEKIKGGINFSSTPFASKGSAPAAEPDLDDSPY